MGDTAAGERKHMRGILLSIALAAFMARLDSSIVNISLPTISHYFNVSTSQVSWVILSYLIMITCSLLTLGKLSERFGVKCVFITGYFLFVLGSLCCGISPTIGLLIASRALQGLGAAMLSVTAYAIIPKFLPANATGGAFGLLSTAVGIGLATGAPLGGFITAFASWHWIFLINIPIGAVAIFTAWRTIPSEQIRPEAKSHRFDILGSLLIFVSILALLLALNLGREKGWASPQIIAYFLTFIIFLVSFLLWETRFRHPLLDLSLFRDRDFTLSNIATSMAFMLIAGISFIFPFYLQYLKGVKVNEAGLIMMGFSLTFMIAGPISGRISDRVKSGYLCLTGMVLATIANLHFALTLHDPGIAHVVAVLILFGIAIGLFTSPNNNLIFSMVPPDRREVAAGAFNTVTALSQAVGVCVFETIFSAAIPHHVMASGVGLASAGISQEILCAGFRGAFLFGAAICLASAIFVSLARKR